MKIVKLKKGYRLTCTDGEFEALCAVVENGTADLQNQATRSRLSVGGKRAMTSYFDVLDRAMRVDEDRRG